MDHSSRARIGATHWLLITGLLGVLVFAPSVVARAVTADGGIEYVKQPWQGWGFTVAVLRQSIDAAAASPGEALDLAQKHWTNDGQAQALEVELAYAPGNTDVPVAVPGGERVTIDDPEDALLWLVTGRRLADASTGVIGAVDFSSGAVVWEIDSDPAVGDTETSKGKDAA